MTREFGIGTVLFLCIVDPQTKTDIRRFGSGLELITLFHSAMGMTPIVRPDAEKPGHWRAYVQHTEGSMVFTGIRVEAADEKQAHALYLQEALHRMLNERMQTEGGKHFLLCEGDKGLLFLLEPQRLDEMFRKQHPLLPDTFFTDETLLDWMMYGSLPRVESMALLSELSGRFPEIISHKQRVNIGLQIIQREKEIKSSLSL